MSKESRWHVNFGTRLGVGFALIVMLLLGTGVFTLRQTSHIGELAEVAERLHRHPFLVSNAALEIGSGISSVRESIQDAFEAGDDRARLEAAIAEIRRHEREMLENLDLVGERYLGDMNEVMTLREDLLAWNRNHDAVVALLRGGDTASAEATLQELTADDTARLEAEIEAIIDFARDRADGFLAEVAEARTAATWQFAGLVLAALTGAAVAVGVIVTRGITHPLTTLRMAMENIANGDLETEVPLLDRRDEVGDMARAVNIFRENSIARFEAERVKKDFLANMSHELRTPLNAIIGFSEIMCGEVYGRIEPARYRGYIRDICTSAEHLQHIINDVLDLARVERGKLELEVAPVDAELLLRETLRMVESDAAERGIRIETDLASGLPYLAGDAHRLRQIVLNLLVNALKFTGEGGTVTVALGQSENGSVEITVSDTGIGMTEREVEVAVSPFGQIATGSRVSGSGGIGLGLPLAIALVEAHGGTLGIDSKPRQGTRIRLRFPAGPDAPPRTGKPVAFPASAPAS